MAEERSAALKFADIIAKEIIEGKLKPRDAVEILRGITDNKETIVENGSERLSIGKEITDLLLEAVASYSDGRLDPVDIIKLLREGKDVYESIKQAIKAN